MAWRPEIRFARATGSSIAYMEHGSGPVTVCAVPPMAQNVEMAWESPRIRAMLEAYGSFSRQIAFDKRGTGMSDRSLDIPVLDERVDELRAVMDAAGVEHAYVHGLSEGGPMAIVFAATYPDRVDGLILEGTGASLISDEQRAMLADPDQRRAVERRQQAYMDAWGTPDSMTLSIFAPSLLDDAEMVDWWPRYERQAASRDALLALYRMNGEMDAREVLGRVECPVLIVHRIGDRVISVDRARETHRRLDEAGADVRLVELDGDDHFTFAGDVDAVVAEIERFTTGTIRARPAQPAPTVSIRTLGRFEVLVDDRPVPTSEWGSKRARTLLKRLIAARGESVSRDELIDMLWPDEWSDRLGARLSVQLSAVRRVLHGAVIADRSSIRLDLDAVDVDLERWWRLAGDDDVVEAYTGEFLPDDRYDDWSTPVRDEVRARFASAAHRVAERWRVEGDVERAERLLRRIIGDDRFDETAHRALVRLLHDADRHGHATTAYESYVAAMAELDVEPAPFAR